MKMWILGLIAACAPCCIPLLIPALSGLTFLGLTLFGKPLTLDTVLCALPLAVLAALAVFAILKGSKRHKAKCRTDGGCGCKS